MSSSTGHTSTGHTLGRVGWEARAAALVLGMAALPWMGSAYAQSHSPAVAALIEKAKAEGQLRLTWGEATLGGSTVARQWVAGINKTYGINIELRFTPVEAFARVASQLAVELQAGQPAFTDLYLGTAAQLVPLIERKMFVSVDWAGLAPGRIKPEMIDSDGASLKIATGIPGAIYNTASGLGTPKNLTDFLAPGWKGRIATTIFGAGFDGLAASSMWGPAKTLDYVRKLAPQVAGFINCTDAERIAVGEFAAFVLDCIGDKVTLFQERGAPIDLFLQPDATARRAFYLQVPRHARSQAAATLLVLYAHSVEGQRILWEGSRVDLVDYPESRTAKRLERFATAGVKFTDVTIPWWQRHPEIGPTVEQIGKIMTSAKK